MAGAVQRAGFALPEKRRCALGTTPSSRCSDSKSETFVTNQEASPRIFGAADAVLGVVIVKVKWLGVRMPDLVVRGMDTMLLERVRRLALSRGWSHRQAVSVLIECGLFYIDTHPGNGFASIETEVLREAASALQQLPDGADF